MPAMAHAAPGGPAVHALHAWLREATHDAHARLESTLNLLEAPIPAVRIANLLEGFHGFHAALEPALHGHVPERLLQPRLKLPLLEQDLQCLGIECIEWSQQLRIQWLHRQKGDKSCGK